jgi:GDPmannose 4,6-dehydratase
VREFVEKAFWYTGIEIKWKGKGTNEKGIVHSLNAPLKSSLTSTLRVGGALIEIDPRYFRPTEVDFLKADISKAKKKLGWKPRTTFDELIKIMVDYDMRTASLDPVGEGIRICEKRGFTYTNHDFSLFSTMIDR